MFPITAARCVRRRTMDLKLEGLPADCECSTAETTRIKISAPALGNTFAVSSPSVVCQ
jgi:hypothetical protein